MGTHAWRDIFSLCGQMFLSARGLLSTNGRHPPPPVLGGLHGEEGCDVGPTLGPTEKVGFWNWAQGGREKVSISQGSMPIPYPCWARGKGLRPRRPADKGVAIQGAPNNVTFLPRNLDLLYLRR